MSLGSEVIGEGGTEKEENHPSPVTSDPKHKDSSLPIPTTTPIIS